MLRKFGVLLVVFVLPLYGMPSNNPIDDAKNLSNQLNPLSLALGPLIDRAAEDANNVLQQRLEQLNGIIQLTLFTLNQIAQQKIDDIDQKTRQQIIDLNAYVSRDLLQFNAIIGKNLSDVDRILSDNLDKFNFGTANTIATIKFLNTVPLLNIGKLGITTFKQKGSYTDLYLQGSGLMKFNSKPDVYLSGTGVKTPWYSGYLSLDVPAASMGLLQIRIPNTAIPDDLKPSSFTLSLKIRDGTKYFMPTYSEQSVPLKICGALPRYKAKITVTASGKKWEYTQIRHPEAALLANGDDYIGVSCKSGNNNSKKDVCPTIPPSGWQIDDSPPDYGLTFGSETGHNYHNYSRTASHCIHLYCEGGDGDAWENIQGVRLKLKRLVDVPLCSPSAIVTTVELPYGVLSQLRLQDTVNTAIGVCKDASASATPQIHVVADILDSSDKLAETRDLLPNIPATALGGAASFSMSDQWLLDMKVTPSCRWTYEVAVK